MGKTERIVVYSILGVLLVWNLVLTVTVAGKLAEINDTLMVQAAGPAPAGGETAGEPAGLDEGNWWGAGAGEGEKADPLTPTAVGSAPPAGDVAQVGIAGLEVLTGSIEMTVTVRAYGAGDLLYEPPVLVTEEGQIYQISGKSLEAARIAFLDLVTSGQSMTRFVFNGRLSPTAGLWLVFNPNQEPGFAIAPPLRVAVPLRTGGTGGQ